MRQFDFDSPVVHSARPQRDVVRMPSEVAIIAFAAFSLFGAIAMSCYCGIGLSTAGAGLKPAADVPVYNAKAVPRERTQRPLRDFQHVSRRRAGVTQDPDGAADEEMPRRDDGEKISAAHSSSLQSQDERSYSFPELDVMRQAAALGTASAVAASVSSQYASAGIEAPDAAFGSLAPVPETSGWSFAGLFAVILCGGERLRRRVARHS
jgi:hypothetical protein